MKTPLTICFLLLCALCYAQVKFQTKTVQPEITLKKGDTHVVSILHSKTKTEKGKPPSASSLRYEAVITVIDSLEDEYTIRWVYRLPKAGTNSPEMQAAARYFEGLEMVYKTDGTGGFKELVNWESVRDFYMRILDETLPAAAGDTLNEALTKAKAMFSTRDMVQTACTKEVQLLHSLYGQSYSTRLEKSSTFMNVPIAQEPVPAMVTAQVTELTPTHYTVKTTQMIDKVGAAKMFEEIFKKIGITDSKTLQEAKAELASFQIMDEGSYTLSTKTGLPIKSVYKRTAGAAGLSQIEAYEIAVK